MRTVLVIVASVLVACGDPPVQKITGPDGNIWNSIHCGVVDDCLRRAGEVCPNGYVERETRTPRAMFIRCKGDTTEWKTPASPPPDDWKN